MSVSPRPAVGLSVPCEIRWISPGIGYGIFAQESIARHTVLWRYQPGNTREYTVAEFLAHLDSRPSDAARISLLRAAFGWKGKMILPLDDSVYWNHSTDPNCGTSTDGSDSVIALRDIHPGEELLDNYLKFEYPQWLRDIYVRLNIDTCFLWPTTS